MAKPFVALVLQGGGALGAYHVGAYQALHEANFAPDWVTGISIGAFNSAIIAGNPLEQRLDKLTAFWEMITRPDDWTDWLKKVQPSWFSTMSYWKAIDFGQPNFFTPRLISPYLAIPGTPEATSWYDTSPMVTTFSQVIDFDLINTSPGRIRISLGATDVESGELVFFDNNTGTTFTPDHVRSSGSLPPGFPPVQIGDRRFWDGACVSNTPLQAVLDDQPKGHCVIFVIDLWDKSGPAPKTLDDVALRQKQIQYATRTDRDIDLAATKLDLRQSLVQLHRANAGSVEPAVAADVESTANDRVDFVHIIHKPFEGELSSSDAEFSRISIQERREAGYKDMKQALAAAPWFHTPKPAHAGAVVHRLESGLLRTRVSSAARMGSRPTFIREPIPAAAE